MARLRVHGESVPDPRLLTAGTVDLAALENGGTVIGCSNMFYSSPTNLHLARTGPDHGRGLGDRRGAATTATTGSSSRLAGPGVVRAGRARHQLLRRQRARAGPACAAATPAPASSRTTDAWFELLPAQRLQPDTRHRFRLPADQEVTHVRLDIYPDGGMARVRLWGELTASGREDLALRWFNLLPAIQLEVLLQESYGVDPAEAEAAAQRRPAKIWDDLPRGLQATLTR